MIKWANIFSDNELSKVFAACGWDGYLRIYRLEHKIGSKTYSAQGRYIQDDFQVEDNLSNKITQVAKVYLESPALSLEWSTDNNFIFVGLLSKMIVAINCKNNFSVMPFHRFGHDSDVPMGIWDVSEYFSSNTQKNNVLFVTCTNNRVSYCF